MIGTLINHRYQVVSELGRGGMGIVYRAFDTLLQREVAVKVLAASTLGSQGRARLLREAQAAARLNHPNIINIYDAGDTDGHSYIVMELLDGESLYDRKPGTLEETLDIIYQICQALDHAHTHGIIHRDLKPENVIVTSKGVAKLTDFGLSRSLSARISQEGIIVGTVYYLAPEQALRQDVDSRADLYALGVLMFELVTGRLPFTADDPLGVISQHLNAPVVPPSTYTPDIPPALDALILRLMSKSPEDRPATAAEVRAALDRLYEEPAEVDSSILAGLSPIDRLVRGRLVGRQEEFNRIKNTWREILARPAAASPSTNAGRENVLVISGEAGVGKSPLIKEVRSLVQVSGGRVLIGECYAQDTAPYAPVIQILHDAEPLPEELPDLVMADLHSLAPDLKIREVPSKPSLSPLSEQQRLFESLFALFSTWAEQQPLIFILEDAHWADGNSLLLVRHLARRARATQQKLLIILAYRPEELEENRTLKEVLLDLRQERLSIDIDLQPFNREKTRDVLSTMFMETIEDGFLDSIYRVTEGNLFFIEEISRALIDEGILYCDGGKWNLGGIEDLELPQSVRVTLQVRLKRLPDRVQDMLRLAAIIGREFDYEILRRAIEQPDEDALIDSIEQAQRAQLIGEINAPESSTRRAGKNIAVKSERFAFAHTLIPTILREEVSSLRRRRMHRRVAGAIESVSPDELEDLAYHYGQAGDQDKARFYTIRAGERARKLYANEEALRFYQDALALTPEGHTDRFAIHAGRAQVYEVLAQRDLQRAEIEKMLELADHFQDNTMRCDALIAMADLFLVTENILSREPAQEAIELARQLEDPVREARALRCAGWGAWARHEYHESLTDLETATARFRQAGMIAQAAECLHMLSLVTGLQGLGELAISRKYALDAVQLSRLAGDPRQESISLRRLAIVYMDRNEYEEAMQVGQQALSLHRELGDRYEECMALNAIAVIAASMGNMEQVRDYLETAYEMAVAIGSSMGIWIILANLMWFHYRREGLYEAGIAYIDRQLSEPTIRKDPFLVTNIVHLKSVFQRQLGLYPNALETLRDACQMADRHSSPLIRASLRLDMARLYADIRHFSEANEALDLAKEQLPKFQRPIDMANVYLADAEVARQEWEAGNLKQIRRAVAQVEQALKLLNGTNWTLELAMALEIAAWIALAQNQIEEALELAEESYELFETLPVKSEGYEYIYVCALWAAGREDEANPILECAYQRVMKVANQIDNAETRKSWLEDVTINHQIVSDWVALHGL